MNINTITPKFKAQRTVLNTHLLPIPGCIYYLDTGNNNYVCGVLLTVNKDEATVVDSLGTKHTGILSTLRSAQKTR